MWALLLVSLVTMIVFGYQKEGYHVDELYSYGLANSEYLPFMHFGEHDYDVKDWMKEYGAGESFADLFRNLIKDYRILKENDFAFRDSVIYRDYLRAQANSADTRTTTWVPGQAYQDYLAVSESNTFNYASVYYNQRGDVHPPLYYILLHTICSVFQGVFSPWFGLAINIVFSTLTLLMLYAMVRRYFGGETMALVTMAVYGLSNGFMTGTMYLRMYVLFTFMLVTCFYVHLRIAEDGFRLKRKTQWMLSAVVLGGFLTHYYFVLLAIVIAAVFSVWILISGGDTWKKKCRNLIRYVMTLAGTAAVGLCVWPFAVKHVFSGYRGQASLNVLYHGDFYLIKVKLMMDQIIYQLFGGQGWVLVMALVLALAVLIRKKGKNLQMMRGLLILLPITVYIVVVSQIVPYLVERYVLCVYPLVCMCVIGAFCMAVRAFKKDWEKVLLAVAGVILLLLNNCYMHPPGYLFTGGQETVAIPEETVCVYVLPDGGWNESATDSSILAQCKQVAVVYEAELACLSDTYKYQEGETVMISVQKDMDINTVLQETIAVLDVEELQETGRVYGATAVSVFLTRE